MGLYDELPLEPAEPIIRLMNLRPAGDRSAPLAVDLYVASLDTNPQYVALSYCWGSSTLTRPIDCNNYVLDITENLGLALSSIRSLSRLPLWVDRICINQGNTRERSSQVSYMQRIYSQATKTFVYLGEPESAATETACKVLETLYTPVLRRVPFDDNDLRSKILHLRARVVAMKLALRNPRLAKRAYDKDVRRAIFELAARPYFTRKWIIQELLKSRSPLCVVGSHCIEWNPLVLGAMLEFNSSCDKIADLRHYPDLDWLFTTNLYFGIEGPSPLLGLMYFSRSFKTTDHRDHIFALLGVASDPEDFLEPNYEKTIEQVYHETSSCLIRQGNGFLMLHLAGIRPTDNMMPSWVVDWRDFDSFYCAKHFASFRSGGGDGIMKLGSDAVTLHVRAKLVDHVGAIGQPFKAEMSLWDRLMYYIQDCTSAFEEFYENSGGKLAIQQDLASLISFDMRYDDQDRVWFKFNEDCQNDARLADWTLDGTVRQMTLIRAFFLLNKFNKWLPRTGQRDGSSGLSRSRRKIKPVKTSMELVEDEVFSGFRNTPLHENLLRFNFFRPTTRPIITKNRRLGLAPALTEVGDVVSVISGANAPFILRPSQDGTYKIVGEVYLQGIMFGETLTDDRYPLEDILIR
jgi:Heterokaryon incompatibility protein (HET)